MKHRAVNSQKEMSEDTDRIAPSQGVLNVVQSAKESCYTKLEYR